MPTQTEMTAYFKDLGLDEEVLTALDEMGYEKPTKIQVEGIPPMVKGSDMVAQAPTGSGKTAAFGCALAARTEPGHGTQALVLTPTRELARQVAKEIEAICKHKGQRVLTIYGGVGYDPQISGLRKGFEIVVGTPGRVKDLMKRGSFKAHDLRVVCLDEADRMLDMGFFEDVSWIVGQAPRGRQGLLFSATIPPEVDLMAKELCRRPVSIEVEGNLQERREELVVRVGRKNKPWALSRILRAEEPELAFVFCRTRHGARKTAGLLKRNGFDAEEIHGDLSQAARERVMAKVRKGQVKVLVGTDVLARGIDVRRCDLVVNYDPPQDPEDYTHRVGRTARFEDVGKAYTLATRDDSRALVEIEGHAGAELTKVEVPEVESKDKITKIHDWQELADKFGMVHFQIDGVPKDASRMDLYWEILETTGVHKNDVGHKAKKGDTMTIEVRHEAAGRFQAKLNETGVDGHDVKVDIIPPDEL
ncbi:MAG: DEAD/DEAH box helicase [Candidatus Thermoplasmatota archaeon]|nr:DEAD/DEAH box helicase [Candidatus Thermoplasmatota archaeon]